MDVILDSNVILEDVTFSRAQFKELLAYLKRTNSRLVLPATVRQEVEARFRERLLKFVNRARDAWDQVQLLSGAQGPSLPKVDVEQAIRSLNVRMEQPGAGIPASTFRPLTGIDMGEVVRRGIHRRKPASPAGEQLRDVIIWLQVKSYAAEMGQQIAFITDDDDFRESKESDQLHPDLAAELKTDKLSVSFHRNIGAFIRSHALTSAVIKEEWITRFVRMPDIRTAAIPLLFRNSANLGMVEHVEIDSIEFSDGTEFKISDTSSYFEASYKGTATLHIWPNVLTINVAPPSALSGGEPYLSPLLTDESYKSAHPALIADDDAPEGVYANDITSDELNETIYTPSIFADQENNALGLNLVNSLFTPMPLASAKPMAIEKRQYPFTIFLSGRIESGKMIAWQVDELEIQPSH